MKATLYLGAFKGLTPGQIKTRLADRDWVDAWIDGLYDYRHYHPEAHEVVVLLSGWARVELGGAGGDEHRLKAGDAVLIPAGLNHRCLEASPDCQVMGAYPPGSRVRNVRAEHNGVPCVDTPGYEQEPA
ncbi:cupin domain-containing protein [Gallaecimonas sp. GXIMD4217]|uniref:cupin domain-containing protein n=1 Tax=Gallaecimonas sp. GXIMD4217 TaxID=3131927 RepID=UPI00311B35E8